MNRFYKAASEVLVETDAYVDKFVGDEVIGLYLPVFTGSKHAALAIDAARRILKATGHQGPEGAWIPVGVGVHTGTPYVGTRERGRRVRRAASMASAACLLPVKTGR